MWRFCAFWSPFSGWRFWLAGEANKLGMLDSMAGTVVNYVTKHELGHDSGVRHLDPAVKAALFSALENDGVYDVPKERAWFQKGDYPGGQPSPIVQILETTDSTSVVTDPALKAIIVNDRGGVGHDLTVTGGKNDEFIALGNCGNALVCFVP